MSDLTAAERVIVSKNEQIEQLQAYKEKVEALVRYGKAKNITAMEAVMVEMTVLCDRGVDQNG